MICGGRAERRASIGPMVHCVWRGWGAVGCVLAMLAGCSYTSIGAAAFVGDVAESGLGKH